jgi:hypothetical protein
MMESRFRDHGTALRGETSSPLPAITTGVGIVLVLLGVYLTLQIFFTVVGAIRNPTELEELLTRWEGTAVGERPFVEMPTRFEFNLAEGENVPPQVLSAEGPIQIHANRFMAVSLLIGASFLLSVLALGLLSGGVKLLSLNFTRHQMKTLALEIQRAQEKAQEKT